MLITQSPSFPWLRHYFHGDSKSNSRREQKVGLREVLVAAGEEMGAAGAHCEAAPWAVAVASPFKAAAVEWWQQCVCLVLSWYGVNCSEVVRLVWVNWGHSSGEQEARKCLASACSPGWVSCITWVPLAHYGRGMEAKRSCSGAARSQLEAGTGLGSPALILLCSPLEVEVRAVQYLLWSSSLQSGHDTRMKCKQKPVAANKTSLRPWWRLMGPPWKWELEFGADLSNHEVLACTGVISMFIHDLNSAQFKNKQ